MGHAGRRRPFVARRPVYVGLGLTLACAGALSAQESAGKTDEALISALEAYIPQVMAQHNTPGLNIAVARRGRVIWEEGFGYADLQARRPMTPETVFHSGSMGKTYTATAVMQLVERGVMGLHDPINQYLPFRVENPLGERDITVHDLLTHRSGLTSNAAGSQFTAPKPLGEHLAEGYAQEYFKSYDGTVLPRWSRKVGEAFQYSNFGIATLGYLVETTNPEGLGFPEYVQRHIIDPLGMTSSMYPAVQDAEHVRPDIFERFSKGYAQFGPVHLPTPTIYFADYPAGTVVSTPGDHIRVLLAYMHQGRLGDYQLLKPETVEQMLEPQVEMGENALGLVWFLENLDETDVHFGHGGAHMYGWTNIYRAYREQDFALVVAANHWPMTHERYREHRAIAAFISEWLERDDPSVLSAPWAWKASYVMGLFMIEQMKGALGIEGPVTPAMVDLMATDAKGDAGGRGLWDASGFRAGVHDMLTVEMTPAGIRAFLESDRLQVTTVELELIHRQLRGDGNPFPTAAMGGN